MTHEDGVWHGGLLIKETNVKSNSVVDSSEEGGLMHGCWYSASLVCFSFRLHSLLVGNKDC